MNFSCVILLIATTLLAKSNLVAGTEDEYEDREQDDNVVEHPGPTFPPIRIEVEEKVLPTGEVLPESDSNLSEEEEIIQTTTYPVFEEALTSTTTESNAIPLTSTLSSSTTSTSTTSESSSTSTGSSVPYLPPHQRPIRSDLASIPPPRGHEILVGNLTIYESPVTNDTFEDVMLISVHDIFGFHPHVKYISDRLSENGFRVVVPDFFHGKPVSIENFPPPNFTETAKFLFNKDKFWLQVKSDLLTTMGYYRHTANVTSFGLYGFCWGGKMIVYSCADSDFQGINAISLVHPSRIVTQDANGINASTLLLPSNAEPDMAPFQQNIQRRLGEDKAERYRYDDMRHGFAGATSDFSNPDVRKRVEDVIEKMSSFFRKHLV